MKLRRFLSQESWGNSHFWLAWLLIAVFALATVWGPELGSAHPKPDLKGQPSVSQVMNGEISKEIGLFFLTSVSFLVFVDVDWQAFSRTFQSVIDVAISIQQVSFQIIRILLRWFEFPLTFQFLKAHFTFSL
ncbi:MAG: hypothetical protein ACPG8A_04790 [Psychrobium sp.]